LVDPAFFAALPGRIPGVQSVKIQLKRGVGANELTRYRYDVVLRAGRTVAPVVQYTPRTWDDLGAGSASLQAELLNSPAAVRVTGIPNVRLARDLTAYRLIQDSEERLEVGVLRRQLKDQLLTGEDPEVLRRWAQAHDLEAHLTWNVQHPDRFDLEWIDIKRAASVSRGEPDRNPDKPWREYANNPSENNARQRLVPELRDYLKRKLPDYMIPAAWVILKQLPLTPNGKVDRRALPTPQARPDDAGEYVAPRNDLERKLAGIWEEVLRVDQVGIQDNFFDLGGQSLLVTQVTDRIQAALSVNVPMKLLFEWPTIELLSAQLERRCEAQLLERIAGGEDDIKELLLSVASMPEARVQELMRDLNRD
jgi:acyl carrier protein